MRPGRGAKPPGSSPRGRGKRKSNSYVLGVRGLIPAWAGKTSLVRWAIPSRWAHPRVGGENWHVPSWTASPPGSSPRGRGKHKYVGYRGGRPGLIPAWAGKTASTYRAQSAPGAHPRVGGENAGSNRGANRGLGSSPRGRGKHATAPEVALMGRLIPAWAGKTRLATKRARRSTAHPRVGGENQLCWSSSSLMPGSSPRGRGKPAHVTQNTFFRGLIPAWAGKTERGATLPRAFPAHPRVGGENIRRPAHVTQNTGSSPRGRGKPPRVHDSRFHLRLIPAWAGKTGCRRPLPWQAPAHPRVGGENQAIAFPLAQFGGSSPRGRGKRQPITEEDIA